MATLKEYFDTDFQRVLGLLRPLTFSTPDGNIDIIAGVHLDFDSNSKFISCYIPVMKNPIAMCVAVLQNLNIILEISKAVEIKSGHKGEKPMADKDLQFSGRVFFYSEVDIEDLNIEKLQDEAKVNGLHIIFRSQPYAAVKSEDIKPLAFISHDSRDKEDVARPIAIGLSKMICPVWFDEYSLKVGNGLRESIEKGIRECKKCILILSPSFLENAGWTKVEFDSFFTRELLEERKLILPVWYKVSKNDIFKYSTSLPDRVGLNWEKLGADEVIRKLYHEIMIPV